MYVDPGAIMMAVQVIAAGVLAVGAWFVPRNWKGIRRWLSKRRASETQPDE